MTSKTLGSGFAPDVAIVDGLVYVAFGAQPDALVLVVLTPGGVEVRRTVIADGYFNSFPRFGGPWLAYQRNHDWRPCALHVGTGQTWTFDGMAAGTYGMAVQAALGIVAYQNGVGYPIRFGSLADGGSVPTGLSGAPDGLDAILSRDRITLRKDTRLSMPGMLYPVVVGDLTVGERPDAGVAVQLAGEPLRVALAGQDVPDPRCATDGTTYAIVCWGPAGVRLVVGTRADLQALPLALTPPAPAPAPTPTPVPPSEDFMDPWKVNVKSFDTAIVRGQRFQARVALGNGVEVVVEKDARDELHFAVFKDGVQKDRSAADRHVDVKG